MDIKKGLKAFSSGSPSCWDTWAKTDLTGMSKLSAYPKLVRPVCFSTENRMDFYSYFYLGWVFRNTMWYITISLFLHGNRKHSHGKAKNTQFFNNISYSFYVRIVGSYGLACGNSAFFFFLIWGSRLKEWVLSSP